MKKLCSAKGWTEEQRSSVPGRCQVSLRADGELLSDWFFHGPSRIQLNLEFHMYLNLASAFII